MHKMNWYKTAQQQMLFYPWDKGPEDQTQRIAPVSIDQRTGTEYYNCSKCGETFDGESMKWYRDTENQGERLQLPEYRQQEITYGLQAIGFYLKSRYIQLQNYIQENNLESKRNSQYDYGYSSALDRWEAQVPELPNIVSKYPSLSEICHFKNTGWFRQNVCELIVNPPSEISGTILMGLEELIKDPENAAKQMFEEQFAEYSGKEFNIQYEVPACRNCMAEFDKCEICNKALTPDQNRWETTYYSNGVICEDCVEQGDADICIECGKADSSYDMRYIENEGSICGDCHGKKGSEYIEWAETVLSDLDIPIGKNPPISRKVLQNLDQFLQRYANKYGNNDITEKEIGRIKHVAQKSNLTKGALEYLEKLNYAKFSQVEDIVNSVSGNIEAQEYMKENAPGISNYVDVPYDVEVVESYGSDSNPSFTIAITPSSDFFDYASTIFDPSVVSEAWGVMSKTPHHPGTMAYARIAYDGTNLVINNLQRDGDYENYADRGYRKDEGTKEVAKWIDNSTKHWDTYLLTLLKAMGIAEEKSVYLTTYDQQKSKWGNLPIHKSRRTYEEVPERMGLQLEDSDASSLLEQGGGYGDPMYRVAKDWYSRFLHGVQ